MSTTSTSASLRLILDDLYPIHRTLMGAGVRKTLERLCKEIPLDIHEVPSGRRLFDWTIPPEWELERAYIEDESGKRWADTAENPLHLLPYSSAIETRLSLEELRPHLHTLPDQPNSIPYRTLYYTKNWGFALPHSLLEQMDEGEYRVVVRTRHIEGSLSYGELFLPGESEEECLFSTYLCHPSLANDNLSGVVLTTALAARLSQRQNRRLSYRFLFLPETIGAITYLATHQLRIAHGLVVTCVGDRGPLTYKRSRRGDAVIDRAAIQMLSDRKSPSSVRNFSPIGSDERQYCSPGFNLPVGSLMRTPYGEYPEYHTSADDLSLLSIEALEDALDAYLEIVYRLESNWTPRSLFPYGEPQLGKRGLYDGVGGQLTHPEAMLWVLNLSDGDHDLLAMAERSTLSYKSIEESAALLRERGLIE